MFRGRLAALTPRVLTSISYGRMQHDVALVFRAKWDGVLRSSREAAVALALVRRPTHTKPKATTLRHPSNKDLGLCLFFFKFHRRRVDQSEKCVPQNLSFSAPKPCRRPRSGTILEHPGHPPSTVTVHLASVPLESLSRGVDRSFVGAPPLRLAAFRRLLDRRGRHRSRSWAFPPSSSKHGVGDRRRDAINSGIEQGLGYGGGMAHGVEGSTGGSEAGEQETGNGGLEGGEVINAGGVAARRMELERAGYLIEVGAGAGSRLGERLLLWLLPVVVPWAWNVCYCRPQKFFFIHDGVPAPYSPSFAARVYETRAFFYIVIGNAGIDSEQRPRAPGGIAFRRWERAGFPLGRAGHVSSWQVNGRRTGCVGDVLMVVPVGYFCRPEIILPANPFLSTQV